MKHPMKILLVLLALCLLLPAAAMAYTGEGTEASPYLIETKADLAQLAADVNSGTSYSGNYFKLTNDIDLGNEEWTPIGKSSAAFSGHFDGGNHTISNLMITSGNDYVGLFGFTTNGEVKNLTVDNARVVGRVGVGAVAGCPYTSKYNNISLTGLVQIDGLAYVGGMLGSNLYASSSNLTVNADPGSYVSANSLEGGNAYRTYVGGVIGFMGEGPITVSDVSSNIDVYGNVIDVGGIVGIIHYGNKFENITCTGNVHYLGYEGADPGDEFETGGIAGTWMNSTDGDVTLTNVSFGGSIYMPDGMTTVHHGGLVGRRYYPQNPVSGGSTINGEAFPADSSSDSDPDYEYIPPVKPAIEAVGSTECTAEGQSLTFRLKNVDFAAVAASAQVSKDGSLVASFEASDNDNTMAIFESGSVKVTLTSAFLATLENGAYTLTIDDNKNVGVDGYSINFIVNIPEPEVTPEPTPEPEITPEPTTPSIPTTGDSSSIALWAALMILSVAAIMVLVKKVRFN